VLKAVCDFGSQTSAPFKVGDTAMMMPDALRCLRIAAGLVEADATDFPYRDVLPDGNITISDAAWILRAIGM